MDFRIILASLFFPLKFSSFHSESLLLTSFIMVAGSVCSSGIYADLLPLSAYPPAAAFCSSHFPEPKCSVTATATQALHKRLPAPNAKGGIVTVYGKPTTTTTSVHTTATTTAKPLSGVLTENAIPYLFGQLELLAEDFVSTACSCIETSILCYGTFSCAESQRLL